MMTKVLAQSDWSKSLNFPFSVKLHELDHTFFDLSNSSSMYQLFSLTVDGMNFFYFPRGGAQVLIFPTGRRA